MPTIETNPQVIRLQTCEIPTKLKVLMSILIQRSSVILKLKTSGLSDVDGFFEKLFRSSDGRSLWNVHFPRDVSK